jgi:uncharacterized protein YdeI (YjbR/CyaY-like superfamily)
MSRDPHIDAYLLRAPAFARPILSRLRRLVHASCPEVEETIKWGHPSFTYRSKVFCSFAAFKAHAAFGFWHQGMQKLVRQDLGRTEAAMGLLGRLTRLEDLPDTRTLAGYFKAAKRLHDSGGPTRPKPKPRPALPVPPDLAAALKQDKPAAATWATLPPSHRREYIEWITEAKRDATRASRLATSRQWLAAGKARNWKYQAC